MENNDHTISNVIIQAQDRSTKEIQAIQGDLAELFDLQAKLQVLHGYNFKTMQIEEKEKLTKDMVLYLLEEVHELLRETNFKTHKKVRKPVDPENIKEELADIAAFYFNLALIWDVTAEQLIEAFKKKNDKNVARVKSQDY